MVFYLLKNIFLSTKNRCSRY